MTTSTFIPGSPPIDQRDLVRRSLNWIVLAGTLFVAAVGGIAIYLVHSLQLKRTADEILVLVSSHEQEEDWYKASQYLDRYLHMKPSDAETRGRLALDFAQHANQEGSWTAKRQAIDLHYRALATGHESQQLELRASLMELLLEHNRFSEAENEAKRILAKKPDDRDASRVLAIALASQLADGSLANANTKDMRVVKNIERARKLNPENPRLASVAAIVWRDFPAAVQAEYPGTSERERQQKSDECLDELVQDNPQEPAAFLARQAHRVKYGLPGAHDDLVAALRMAPDDREVLLRAAVASFNEASRLKQAGGDATSVKDLLRETQGYFEKLVNRRTEERIPHAFMGLGDTFYMLDDVDQAIATWEKGLQQFKQPTTLVGFHSRIAEICIERDRLSRAGEALDAIDQLLTKLGGSIRRDEKLSLSRGQDLRRASFHIRKNNLSGAVPLLRDVILSQPKGDKSVQSTVLAWRHLGSIHSSNGEWMDAATAFDQAGNLDPGQPATRLAAATAWLYAGRPDLASERAEQALHHTSAPEAWMALALAQVQQQAMLPAQQRSWFRLEKALSMLESAKSQFREGWRIDFLRAEYLLSRARGSSSGQADEDAAEARKVLQAAEQVYGGEKTFWYQLALIYQGTKQTEDADRAVAAYRKAGGTESDASVLEAGLARLRGDYPRAQSILAQASKAASSQEQERMQGELLMVTLAAKDTRQARAMLVQQHHRNPQHIGTIRRLAELDLEQRNLTGVREWEKKLEQAGPLGDPQARYYRAWRMLLSAADDKDSQLHDGLRDLEQAMLVRPNWAEAATLKGMIEVKLGRKEQAAAAFERAVQLGERRLLVFEQLIMLLDGLNRSAEVEKYLARLEADVPLSQRLAEVAMVQEIRRDRPEQAVGIAQTRVKQRPDDPLAQLWLGRLLMITGKTAEAERSLTKATELGPTDGRFWNALLDFYVRTKNRDAMNQAVTRLSETSGFDATQKSLILARAFQSLGNLEEAQKNFAQAADSAPADVATQLRVAQFFLQTNPQKAKKHLEAALKLDPASKPAKQMLAIAHAALGELDETQALLSAVGEDGTIAADDVRLSALLLLQRGGEANVAMAVAKIEELVTRTSREGSAQATDRLLLARLYEQQSRLLKEGDASGERLKRAEEQILAVAQRPEAEPAHLAAMIQFLVRHDRKEQAEPWLTKLETKVDALPKEDPATIVQLIQVQIQHGSANLSERWLKKLEAIDPAPLRALALRTQVALALNSKIDVENLVEPKATNLESSVKTSEDRKKLFMGIGDLYAGAKADAAAERWYQKLRDEDPSQYAKLVKIILQQGRVGDAVGVCEKAMSTDKTIQPVLLLATVLSEGKPTDADFERAEPLLATALKNFEKDSRVAYAVALVRVMQQKNSDSVALFRKVVAASPRSVPALNNLAMLLADAPADRPEALKLIDQAIEVAGNDARLLDTKGAILLYSGRVSEAVPLLELAIRDADADPRHHFHLALAYRDQGKIEDAKTQLQTALDRQLVSQMLTHTDQQLLGELRKALRL